MEVRPEQPENALVPMQVTLDGIVTEVNLEQPENAFSAMPFVPSMIVMFVLVGIVPLYLYATFPAYTSPSGWLSYHPVPSNA